MHSGSIKRSPMKRFFKAIFIIVLSIAIAFAGLIAFISLTEYKPDKVERIRIYGNASKGVKKGDSIKVMSWNIGYGALGDNADFFMDGGNHVLASSKNRVKKNIKSISGEIRKQSPDITMITSTKLKSLGKPWMEANTTMRGIIKRLLCHTRYRLLAKWIAA